MDIVVSIDLLPSLFLGILEETNGDFTACKTAGRRAFTPMKHEQYTQKLRRILTTLDTETFEAVPRALYVFGSYSRGAPEPGDLDLLLVYDRPDNHEDAEEAEFTRTPFTHYMRDFSVKLFRRGEKRRIMYDPRGEILDFIRMGAMMMDESDLILLWSSEDRDWEPKLNAIKVDPTAGRAVRNHFCELGRLECGTGSMHSVMKMLQSDDLKMEKIPVDLKNDSPPILHDPDNQRLIRVNEKCRSRTRVKHAQILRHGLWWFERESQSVMEDAWFETMVFSKSQTHLLLLGKPPVPVIRIVFSKHPNVQKVCLIPTFHAQKENAIYVFERGPQWSLERNALYPD